MNSVSNGSLKRNGNPIEEGQTTCKKQWFRPRLAANGEQSTDFEQTGPSPSSIPLSATQEHADENIAQIASWLRLFVEEGEVAELRTCRLSKPSYANETKHGFFDSDHFEEMAQAAFELSGDFQGVYFTLNPIKPELLSRSWNRVVRAYPGDATTDNDVLCRRWLFIDADPQCEGGSATDEEKAKAEKTIQLVRSQLTHQGWPQPIFADSGNGYHLLYRIDLPTDDGGLVKRVLQALNSRFGSKEVKIDPSVANPARICKLYGTMARKGENTEDRPHRRSKVLDIPDELRVVPQELLEALAVSAPPESCRPPVATVIAPEVTADRESLMRRARAYLSKIPGAISGQGGHDKTFHVACVLVRDFALSMDEASPLILEWNETCVPPWEEKDLRRKLTEADKKEGPRGSKLPPSAAVREAGSVDAFKQDDDPHRLARLYLTNRYTAEGELTLRCWRDEWWRWENGCYRVVTEAELRAELWADLEAEFNRINKERRSRWADQVAAGEIPAGKTPCANKVCNSLVSNVLGALSGLTTVRVCVRSTACLFSKRTVNPVRLTAVSGRPPSDAISPNIEHTPPSLLKNGHTLPHRGLLDGRRLLERSWRVRYLGLTGCNPRTGVLDWCCGLAVWRPVGVLVMVCARGVSLAVGSLLVLFASNLHGADVKLPQTDLYGDPLPPGAVMRLGTIRLRHRHAQIAFSKDGKQLISCDDGGKILVWDVVTGRPLCEKRLPWAGEAPGSVLLESLSPDGTMATGEDSNAPDAEHALSICDLKTAKERGKLSYSSNGGFNLVPTFSPDGKLLAIPMDGTTQQFCWEVWDVASLKKRQTLTNPAYALLSIVAFSPDGKRLAGLTSYEDGSGIAGRLLADLLLWDTTSGRLLARREKLKGTYAESLAFSPDGKTLALGGKKEMVVRFFSADTLKEKSGLKEQTHSSLHRVHQLVFSPDGRRFSAVYGKWNSNAEYERSVLVWELDGAKEPRRLPAHYGMQVAFSPDGKTLACNDGGKIRLYDAATGRPLHQPPLHDDIVRTLAASADGKRIASRDELGVLNLWDTTTGKGWRISERRDLDISACSFTADGKYLVAVGRARTLPNRFLLQTWAAADGKAVRQVEANEDGDLLSAAALSTDGKRVMTVLGVGGHPAASLVIWDLFSGKRLQERTYKLQIHPGGDNNWPPTTAETHAAFSPSTERLSVWLGDRVGLEDVSTGSLLAKLPKMVRGPLAFSSDGRLLATTIPPEKENDPAAANSEVRALIEAASGEEIFRLRLNCIWDTSVCPSKIAFTPNGRGLVISDHKSLCVWDTATGDKLYQMAWPESIVRARENDRTPYVPCIVALPGGRVAASMTEGDILIWDLEASTWPKRKPTREPGRKELESLWSDLAGDARKAHRAIHVLTTTPNPTIAFFEERFLPVTDGQPIEKLLADLDSDAFQVREAATRALTRLHYRAEPRLRQALENKPSLEMRRRIEAILAKPRLPSTEELRVLRAIAVLERIGTSEARRILKKLGGGTASPARWEAQAALQRLRLQNVSVIGRSGP